jgi:prepilin-type N-terminal cleavage/methylation domain-containing protein
MEHVSTLRGGAQNEQGFSLPETLVAIAILSIGLVGVLAAAGQGATSVDSARRGTTALFLAEQRLEQVKGFAVSASASQGWTLLTTAQFPAEGYGTIGTGYEDYRRAVTVTLLTGSTTVKRVDVQVFYRPVAGTGGETSVTVSTQLVTR